MIEYVRLKNFMSFKDTMFDFRDGKKIKQMAAIYGENGSGKTNFVISLYFLKLTLESFDLSQAFDLIYNRNREDIQSDHVLGQLTSILDIKYYMKQCHMAECDEPAAIELGFRRNGHSGRYEIAFSDDAFTYESLYYFTGKRSGTLFCVSQEAGGISMHFSSNLFHSIEARKQIENEIRQYWGKHSLLSIFCQERRKKNNTFIKDSYLPDVYDLPDFLSEMRIQCEEDRSRIYGVLIGSGSSYFLDDLAQGSIQKEEEKKLNCAEEILRDFFTQAYSDVKDVGYKRNPAVDRIAYRLYFDKMIGGKIRRIDFERESAGTHKILNVIHSLFGAFCGMTVVYDELDNGIHDILVKAIISSLKDDITGQIITTTHNTALLEVLDAKSAYVIDIDYMGNKTVNSIDDLVRIQPNNNMRSMYLKGLFGGTPVNDEIDYGEIIQILRDNMQEYQGD